MEKIFLADWRNSSQDEILDDFNVPANERVGVDIVFAYYLAAHSEGYAFVVFRNPEGKLFEVHGSHCSCYGLEEQWSPEEVSIPALEHILKDGAHGCAPRHVAELFLAALPALELK